MMQKFNPKKNVDIRMKLKVFGFHGFTTLANPHI
jgi:hypothetical protein